MSTKTAKNSPVSLVQNAGVVMPNSTEEVQNQSALDTAEEVAQKHEKAVLAVIPHCEQYIKTHADFFKTHADFFAWIELDKAVREDAYIRAQKAALKAADQDVDSELSKLEIEIAKLKAQKERNAIAVGWANYKEPKVKAKRGPKAASIWAAGAFNESDLLAQLSAAPAQAQSAKEIAATLKADRKLISAALKELGVSGKVKTVGQKAGMKYLLA